jgi:RNA polymerase sigma-70 factor (ECF subfamily)
MHGKDPDPGPDDRDLILRSRNGDRQAFGALVRRYQQRVHALGIRLLGSSDDADDLVQETFLRAWRALDRFDPGRPLAPWLARIATNRALSTLAGRSRRRMEEIAESLPSGVPLPDEDESRRRFRERVQRALLRLPDDQRAVIALRAGEELSYREIAEVLDVPIGTVMSRLSRAREALRRSLGR